MSGHSKWNNIKRKKEKTDAARAKIFTKIGKEMAVAIRAGGPNPDNNSKLRELIAKAKANNVPNDNIERAIKKFKDSDVVYEEITYEGYGPAGVAVIVEAATDSRNRTAGDVRHYFDKCGGNLGVQGCVGFMFTEMGLITIDDEDEEVDEEALMEAALEAGAADFSGEDNVYEITTEVDDLEAVSEALRAAGYKITTAELTKIPSSYVTIEDEEAIANMEKMLDYFDDCEDITAVYHNWEN
ncbi:MAG: YebC/PmpR family DNA-binding transcriptional regulator [Clostridia bacterium]|nr:YebC/PmpR family DNA-binding transcriptional regulator [Clostridia bacterium]